MIQEMSPFTISNACFIPESRLPFVFVGYKCTAVVIWNLKICALDAQEAIIAGVVKFPSSKVNLGSKNKLVGSERVQSIFVADKIDCNSQHGIPGQILHTQMAAGTSSVFLDPLLLHSLPQ